MSRRKKLSREEFGQLFGKNLKKARVEKGYTMGVLAELVGLYLPQINAYEGGRIIPSKKTADLLCDVLDVTLAELGWWRFHVRPVKVKPRPKKPEVPKMRVGINKRGALFGPYELDVEVPIPEPKPGAKEFGWRSRDPEQSGALRVRSRKNSEDASEIPKKDS